MNLIEQIARAQEVRTAHAAALLDKQNVIACGVGYKISWHPLAPRCGCSAGGPPGS